MERLAQMRGAHDQNILESTCWFSWNGKSVVEYHTTTNFHPVVTRPVGVMLTHVYVVVKIVSCYCMLFSDCNAINTCRSFQFRRPKTDLLKSACHVSGDGAGFASFLLYPFVSFVPFTSAIYNIPQFTSHLRPQEPLEFLLHPD